ncbi:hypothetical protein RND71_018660 [Anisodus tanguticus]|uniref:TPX2 central domain-containing protein n=1 Tax=Anisodus tanguticus TaxID=243964 RepID=A0AAE1S337_9SOLA|nr:hypothetical protein RND71_018660 [Anisodus tanguticus]
MEEFIVECLDVSEIDLEYEFDAARFYDFCRPESTSEAEDAERWFQTAGNYPPSPLIIKLNLGKEITAGNSNGCSRLQEGKPAKSKCNNSYIPVGSEVSPSKSKTRGIISKGQATHEICKTKPEPGSSKARGSTLMKPTASHLAKQKSQKTSNKTDVKSSQNSLASENIATKRQKLEIGYLLKIAHLKHQRLLSHKISKKDTSSIYNSAHPKSKVTVPREPQLEILQRAQRRMCNKDSKSSEITKAKTQMLKAQPLNRNILKAPTLLSLRKTRAPLPEFQVINHGFSTASNSTLMFNQLSLLLTLEEKTRALLPNLGLLSLSNSPNADSAAQNALVDFRRPNTQNAVKQGKSVTSLKSRSHKCNKIFPSREDNGIGEDFGQESTYSMECKSIFDEKLSLHPPIELLNKLSLRSEKEKSDVSQPKKNPSAKELKENAPNYLQIKFRKCVGKPNQCATERGTPRIGYHSSMSSLSHLFETKLDINLAFPSKHALSLPWLHALAFQFLVVVLVINDLRPEPKERRAWESDENFVAKMCGCGIAASCCLDRRWFPHLQSSVSWKVDPPNSGSYLDICL